MPPCDSLPRNHKMVPTRHAQKVLSPRRRRSVKLRLIRVGGCLIRGRMACGAPDHGVSGGVRRGGVSMRTAVAVGGMVAVGCLVAFGVVQAQKYSITAAIWPGSSSSSATTAAAPVDTAN